MKLAEVTVDKLSDKAAAFRHARKAWELAPTDDGSFPYLEGWARSSGEWVGFAQAIQERLASPASSLEERRDLRMKLA